MTRRQATGNREQGNERPSLPAACRLFPVPLSRGFTLIELLVYLGLVSVALTITTTLTISLLEAEAHGIAREAVDTSASRALAQITEATRAATALNPADSSFGTLLGRLSLTMRDPARSPTVFSVSDSRLMVSEGAGAPIPLTSTTAEVLGFNLSRLNPSGAKEGVQITLVVRFRNPENNPAFPIQFAYAYVVGLVLR